MIPLRDDNPTRHFPVITLLLIGLNFAAFLFWEPTFGTEAQHDLSEAVQGVEELDRLNDLFKFAMRCNSLGEFRAALSLADGAVVADPFCRTLELVHLLKARAAQLSGASESGRRRRVSVRARFARLAPR